MMDPERPRDVPGPSDDLRSWLSERACLMVLDDVSLADEARPLLVGAAGRPTVVIARDVKVADDLAVPAVRLEADGPRAIPGPDRVPRRHPARPWRAGLGPSTCRGRRPVAPGPGSPLCGRLLPRRPLAGAA